MARAVALLLLAVMLGGCADVRPEVPPTATPAPAWEHDGESYRPNLWLLDAPKPAGTRVSGGAEPSILADRDGEFLWIGDTTGAYYSTDNGTTWRAMPNFLLPSVLRDGWALAQDDEGALYAAALIGPDIDVARSTDGKTWDSTTRAAAVSGTTDRPWLAARGDGEVVLFYYDGIAVAAGIYEHCARSTDRGATWLDRKPDAGFPQGGNAVFDDDGNFYYADDDGTAYRFAGSCLGGATTRSMFHGTGANNMIQLATDGDVLYSAAAGSGNGNIVLSGSRDFGSPRMLTVSPPVLRSNTFATVSAHEGQVAVAWYGSETPGDPSAAGFDGAFNVYVAVVDDFWGTPTVRHVRLTEEPNHVGDICMDGIGCTEDRDRDLLDYFMLDHDRWGGIHVAYGHDGDGSTAQVRYAHIPPLPEVPGEPEQPGEASGDRPPVASFEVREHDNRVRVDASASSDPEGGDLSFVWDWGDGTPVATGVRALHEYDGFGVKTITLTATDEAGNVAQETWREVVGDQRDGSAPVAGFSHSPLDPVAGRVVEFRDRTVDDEDDVASWSWRFGDGRTSSERDPKHVYDGPGTYTVELTVEDGWGMRSTRSADVTVQAAPAPESTLDAPAHESPGPAAAVLLLALALLAARRRP